MFPRRHLPRISAAEQQAKERRMMQQPHYGPTEAELARDREKHRATNEANRRDALAERSKAHAASKHDTVQGVANQLSSRSAAAKKAWETRRKKGL